MLEDINEAVKFYQDKWKAMAKDRTEPEFFTGLKPTAVGWKVKDRAEYDELVSVLHDQCSQLVETWINGRWIAKLVLRDKELDGGIRIIKVMERRPDSTDAVGLDHVDFYAADIAKADQIIRNEQDLKCTTEFNDATDDYTWLSIWFEGTEAKIKPYTVLDTLAEELQAINTHIKDTNES